MDFSALVNRRGLAQKLSPSELHDRFIEYMTWKANGGGCVWKNELIKFKGEDPYVYPVPHYTPATVKEFSLYAGVSHRTLSGYMNPYSKHYPAYGEIMEYISDVCAVHVFNGAVTGVFNGNMVVAMIGKSFEAHGGDSERVEHISHRIEFANYEDVTTVTDAIEEENAQKEIPQNVIPENRVISAPSSTREEAGYVPLPNEIHPALKQLRKAMEEPSDISMEEPPPNDYDTLPPKHSGHFNQAEHNARNNITPTDDSV